jgi:hypothetical protein
LPLELNLPDEPVRTITMDLGRGGFSTTLHKVPDVKETLGFSMKLPGGGEPLVGRARLVDFRKQVGNHRVSMAFVQLAEADQDRIERVLFDSVLARLSG